MDKLDLEDGITLVLHDWGAALEANCDWVRETTIWRLFYRVGPGMMFTGEVFGFCRIIVEWLCRSVQKEQIRFTPFFIREQRPEHRITMDTHKSICRLFGAVFSVLLLSNAIPVLTFPVFAAPDATETVFATKTQGIRLEPSSKSRSVGRVFVATRLAVLERTPGWWRVEVRGWHQEGAERLLYALPGKRIMSAAVEAAVVDRLRPLDAITDPETAITWKGAAFGGWIKDKAVTPDLTAIWEKAWDLFVKRCTVCHPQRIPHNYTANQWIGFLKVMGPRTGLSKDKQRLILKYLQNHAKDTVGGPAAGKP